MWGWLGYKQVHCYWLFFFCLPELLACDVWLFLLSYVNFPQQLPTFYFIFLDAATFSFIILLDAFSSPILFFIYRRSHNLFGIALMLSYLVAYHRYSEFDLIIDLPLSCWLLSQLHYSRNYISFAWQGALTYAYFPRIPAYCLSPSQFYSYDYKNTTMMTNKIWKHDVSIGCFYWKMIIETICLI